MKDFPVIETERLVLKNVTDRHAQEVFQHFANEEVNKFVDFDPAENLADAQEIIDWGVGLYQNGDGLLWGIFNKADDVFMGQVNFVNKSSENFTGLVHRTEIGFDLSPRHWGNGYMAEAMERSISWIFKSYKIGIKRIEAVINTKNHRAEKVVSKMGFQKEGVLRDYVAGEDGMMDMSLFSLLKKEWTKEPVI